MVSFEVNPAGRRPPKSPPTQVGAVVRGTDGKASPYQKENPHLLLAGLFNR